MFYSDNKHTESFHKCHITFVYSLMVKENLVPSENVL